MTNPSSGWDKVPVTGVWKNLDGTPKTGRVVFTLAERVYASDGSVIYPAGGTVEAVLGAETGSISLMFPASDDPDILPKDWTVKVEEKFPDNSGRTYYIMPTLASGGINLGTVILPPGGQDAPPPALMRSVPGGVAGLDSDGDVIDASGAKVSGGGVSSWNDLTDKPATYPPTIGANADQAVAGNDARLADQRVPTDNSVTDTKVAADAAINADKLVDGATNKLMSGVDKLKLASIASGATVNATDAQLRDRATHTGTQPIDSVDGLQVALDGKAATSHTHASADITDLVAILRSTDAVAIYSGSQPARASVTTDPLRRVTWVSATPPIVGGGYAQDGSVAGQVADKWEVTS